MAEPLERFCDAIAEVMRRHLPAAFPAALQRRVQHPQLSDRAPRPHLRTPPPVGHRSQRPRPAAGLRGHPAAPALGAAAPRVPGRSGAGDRATGSRRSSTATRSRWPSSTSSHKCPLPERPVSRVLFRLAPVATIPLGPSLPAGSSNQPGVIARATRPLSGLASGGVCRASSVTGRAVRSYRTVSPLPVLADGRSVFCGTFLRVASTGR